VSASCRCSRVGHYCYAVRWTSAARGSGGGFARKTGPGVFCVFGVGDDETLIAGTVRRHKNVIRSSVDFYRFFAVPFCRWAAALVINGSTPDGKRLHVACIAHGRLFYCLSLSHSLSLTLSLSLSFSLSLTYAVYTREDVDRIGCFDVSFRPRREQKKNVR